MSGATNDPPVTLAAIAGAHGVTGEVRLKLFAESLDSLKRHGRFDAGGRPLRLKSLKQSGKWIVARFEGVGDRNAAEALRGTPLTVPRSALPEPGDDEIYVADLVGRPAFSAAGAELGRVVAVENFGASDILEIERPEGGRFMVPFTAEAVPQLDPDLLIADEFVEGLG
ncbi:16S rRNA processing protein RimM [Pacificimonas flava]|uniref:Ribosome maturation factor RimM n=2 Tax=Pacificimonas TaxID=1960290 RepID=A0A219B4H0_9SPHN|nr:MULTISPECIES: ribosome maturation factor RimM [Pacificimonas]MBZ6377252.1 16S rRNA processing protein RimM [Pacificimonas aurantium]OWV33033.1 16S rRNA processing protein RimM [Pacificimonas flava]